MKKMMKVAAASVLAMGIAGSAFAASENGSITMTVVAPVTMTALSDVAFGNVPVGTTPTALTVTSDIDATSGVAITVTPSAVSCPANITGTVTADAGNSAVGTGAADTHTFDVGVVVGAAAAEGAATCSYSITADYS